ncbi:MAG TPA: hypothetical protein VN961_12490 [Streptosporangiaceae bacterium]|nr:hypothetical protein [Streptosporangiaceae bacterium]
MSAAGALGRTDPAKLALPIQRFCPLMAYSSRSLRALMGRLGQAPEFLPTDPASPHSPEGLEAQQG